MGKGKDGRSDIIFNRRIQPDGKIPIGFKESFDYKKGYQGRITNGNPESGLIRSKGLSRKEGESFYYPRDQKAQFHEDIRIVERQWGK